ncbi:MAG: EAL domain-containing protein [Cellulosilyticaceae bacterium]
MQRHINEKSLQKAFEYEEFEVYFQPKYDLETYKMIGAEALVRWQYKNQEYISPTKFIPIMEQENMIKQLDLHILDQVCGHIREWLDGGEPCVPVSVNLSTYTLHNIKEIKEITDIIEWYQIPSRLIEIEITETALCKDTQLIEALSCRGFKIAMDDFGTGYSSLAVLRQLPIDTIKLDRAFLCEIEIDVKGRIIFEYIVKLCQALKIAIVVEGIETKEQLSFVKAIQCEYGQGFLLDRPLTKTLFEERIKYKNNCRMIEEKINRS